MVNYCNALVSGSEKIQKGIKVCAKMVAKTGGKTATKAEAKTAAAVEKEVNGSKLGEACKAYVTPQIKAVPSDEELITKLGNYKTSDIFDEEKLKEIVDIRRELVENRGYIHANSGKHVYINPQKASLEDLQYILKYGFLKKEIKLAIMDEIAKRLYG